LQPDWQIAVSTASSEPASLWADVSVSGRGTARHAKLLVTDGQITITDNCDGVLQSVRPTASPTCAIASVAIGPHPEAGFAALTTSLRILAPYLTFETPPLPRDAQLLEYRLRAPVTAVALSPKGAMAVYGTDRGVIQLLDATGHASPRALPEFFSGHVSGARVTAARFFPSGEVLASAAADGIRVFSLEFAREAAHVPARGSVRDFSLFGRGRFLAAAATGGLCISQVATQSVVRVLHDAPAVCVDTTPLNVPGFSPADPAVFPPSLAVSVTDTGRALLWTINGTDVGAITSLPVGADIPEITHACFVPSSDDNVSPPLLLIAAGRILAMFSLSDPETPLGVSELPLSSAQAVSAAGVGRAVIGLRDGCAVVVGGIAEGDTMHIEAELTAADCEPVTNVAYAPGTVAVASRDGAVRFYAIKDLESC
jgi:WD40 repeat protein